MSIITSMHNFLHKNKLSLSSFSILAGIPLTVLSVISILYKDGDTDIGSTLHDMLGSWAYWVVILGLILSIAGLYYLADFVKKAREFKKLMDTLSKAKFIKNLDRIEELAWRLHPKHEKMVIERKKKLNIK